MKQIRLIISGDVQGVGYRAWAKRKAESLSLVGWVKNREDKAVEIIAEGRGDQLKTFIELCKQGPDVCMVEHVAVVWSDGLGKFTQFDVLY